MKLALIALLIVAFGIGVLDVGLYLHYGEQGTISWQIWELSHQNIVIPFIAGFLSAHLFWHTFN